MADSETVSKLRAMAQDSVDEAQAIQVSIDQVQDQIDELTEQADAISDALMDPAASQLESYLNGKARIFQDPGLTFQGFWESGQSYAVDDLVTIANDTTGNHYVCIQAHTSDSTNRPNSGASWTSYWVLADPLTLFFVVLGANYNVTSLSDWSIIDATATPVYQYLGAGWDSDAQIIELQDDWDFGCDYLNHPLGVSPSGPACVTRVAAGVIATYGINPNITSLTSAKTLLTNNKTKVEDSKDVFERYVGD